MQLKKGLLPILIVHSIALTIFIFIFLSRQNYEFLAYAAVIVFFMTAILLSSQKIDYPNLLLWGLTVWSILHMSGGGIYIGATRLYDLMLLNLVGEPYNILKFDQFVHAFGFMVATILMYYLLKPLLRKDNRKWTALSVVVVMAGLGAGALNETIEFLMTVFLSSSGVGGYENTGLDLVSNLVGALAAILLIRWKEKK